MASAEPQCDICQQKHITKPAIVWCSECDEAICSVCSEHHGLAKLTKNHKTIPIEDYHCLPESVVAIQHHCIKHGEKFDLYCPSHTAPCCVKCVIETHRQCNVDLLRDVVQGIKQSAEFADLENSLYEIRDNYRKIKDDNSVQMNEIESQASSYKKDIRKFRRELNAYLDRLEQQVENELLDKKQGIRERITKFTLEIDQKLTNSEKNLNNITQVKQHASNLQTFLALKEIEEEVQGEMQYIEDLRKNPSWKTFSLQFKLNPELKCFMQKVKLWGEVLVNEKERSITNILTKNREAQLLLPTQTMSTDIDKITLKKKTTIEIKENYSRISGCEILPDGKLVLLLDDIYKLLIYDNNGTYNDEFITEEKPCDIAYIGNDKIAITSFLDKNISLLDMKTERLNKLYECEEKLYGIAYKDNKLFVRCSGVGIRVITLSGTVISDIKFDSKSTPYLAVSQSDRIYYPIKDNKEVVCCDIKGSVIWRINDVNASRITCQTNGTVFVTDFSEHSVIAISADGTKRKQILDKSNGLLKPFCIHYNDKLCQLLVCNSYDRNVFLYDVS